MTNTMRSNRVIAATVIAALLIPMSATAADVQIAADVGVGTSDNIQRTPTNERSETIEEVGLQFSVQNRSSRLSTDMRGDLAYLNYDKNTYSSELIGNAGAAFRLGLVEDRLSWSLEDVFGQTRRDPFSMETPLNRQNVNYFSTGPNLLVKVGSADRLVVNARYGRVDYQTDLYSTERYSAQAGYEHGLSSVSSLSINLNQEHVEPQISGGLVPAYNHQRGFLRYSLDGSRTKATLDLGVSRVDRGGLADSGVLARLDLSRKFGEISTITLRAGRQITDAGGSLGWSGGASLPTTGLTTQALPNTLNPFTSTYADLGWTLTGHRTHVTFGGSVYDESYAGSPQLDRKRYGAIVRADRQLTPRLTARAGVMYNKYDYSQIAGSNDDTNYDLGFNWAVGKRLSLDLSAIMTSYSSQLIGRNFDETRIWLKLRYANVR